MQPIDCPPLRDFAESDCPFSRKGGQRTYRGRTVPMRQV